MMLNYKLDIEKINEDLQKDGYTILTEFVSTSYLDKISNNIERWWNSEIIQIEIDKFRNVYSSTTSKPTEKLLKLIHNHA